MARKELILDRYEVLGTAGSGGFGTVHIAWDPRIQRKVAIKTIELTESDAYKVALSDKNSQSSAQEETRPTEPSRQKALSPASRRQLSQAAEHAEHAEQYGSKTSVFETSLPEIKADEKTASVSKKIASQRYLQNLPRTIETSENEEDADVQSEVQPVPWRGLTPWGEWVEAENEKDALARRDAYWEEKENISPQNNEADIEFEYDSDSSNKTIIVDDGKTAKESSLRAAGYPNNQVPTTVLSPVIEEDLEEEQNLEAEPITALAHVPGLDEARTAAMLSDSRIVTVYDFEVRQQTAYLIMEYVEGITLTELLSEYADFLTLDMVTGVFDAVAGALMVAHKTGVLHLDIKPDNIIINSDGQAKVTDFGLATLADASGVGTTGGGTIGYMPLEQMRRQHLDARSDEWSLASVAYEMLTGDNPFRARNLTQAQQAIQEAELILPSLCWEDMDEQLDDVLFYALDPNPDERYESVKDFTEELDKFLGDVDRGKEQLSLVVADALGADEGEDETEIVKEDSGFTKAMTGGFFGWHRQEKENTHKQHSEKSKSTLWEKLEAYSEGDEEASAFDERYSETQGGRLSRQERRIRRAQDREEKFRDHTPIALRVPESVRSVAGRLFNAGGSAFVVGFGLYNLPLLQTAFGYGASYGVAIGAIIAAVIGVIRPILGALVSFCFLGAVLLINGHPIVGAALIVATALWWYITGREGPAESNVALLGPLAGSVGLGAMIPFVAGASLRPVQAGVTTAFALFVACVFASFGSSSLLGWDIFSHWSFAGADITYSFVRMITRPLTLTMALGWIGGAVALSVFSSRHLRGGVIFGVVIAVAAVLAGCLVFTTPTPQLFLSVLLGAAVVLAVLL